MEYGVWDTERQGDSGGSGTRPVTQPGGARKWVVISGREGWEAGVRGEKPNKTEKTGVGKEHRGAPYRRGARKGRGRKR